MRHLSVFVLILALFISCKKQESGSQSSSSSPNFQGSCTIGKWTGGLPLDLKMSDDFIADYGSVPAGQQNPLEQMAQVWNSAVSPGKTLFKLPFVGTTNRGYSALNSFHDNEYGIYKSMNWFSGVSSSALAITQYFGTVRSDSGLGTYIDLSEADIIFNYRDFRNDFVFNGNPFYYDVPTVLLHEMGHFLGLCHESLHTSIMAPYYSSTQRTLKTWDSNKIQGLYLNNQNITAISAKSSINAMTIPEGTIVKGIIELNANGLCRHYLNGKVVYEHTANLGNVPAPNWYKFLPLR